MEINFPTRSQTKISLTKAVTYPRHYFVDREVEKIKEIKIATTHSQQLQVNEIMGKIKLRLKRSAKVIYIEALKLFILQKYGCNKGVILLEHSTFKGIAFIIAMRSRKFNKYLYLHL